MSDKLEWEVEHLKKESKRYAKEMQEFRSFRDSTVEKLIIIFRMLEEIKEESRWLKRMFTSALVGGIATGVISLIVGLIKG